MSPETLNLLGQLLATVTISPTSDDFMEQARRLDTARTELLEELAHVTATGVLGQ